VNFSLLRKFVRRTGWVMVFPAAPLLLPAQESASASAPSGGPRLQWICSTESHPWAQQPDVKITPAAGNDPAASIIDPTTSFQRIDGFGGCFNELGWAALRGVGAAQRTEALKALFDPSGCGFTNCRMGIGANDFALKWYSFDETPGDFSMAHFSIARDRKILIPYIKAAMAYSPQLRIWGVPWSPPSWMKTNDSYKLGRFRMEPRYLSAYALYFSRYVQTYRREGIPVYAVHPQNEPTTGGINYPKCHWNGRNLRTFVRDYLVPQLRKDGVAVEVWMGTINDGKMKDFTRVFLDDPATNPLITGVGYQYGGQDDFAATHAEYPDKKMMQTETECYHGENSWKQGMTTFGQIVKDLGNFANGYDFWNLILNQKHTSTWHWKQISLLILDSATQQVTYNSDFYAMKHFAHFVREGAHRIGIQGGTGNVIGFRNPAGEIVVAFGNNTDVPVPLTLQLAGSSARLSVPPHSMNTAVLTGW
jgi:glucosylceramidase